MACKRNDNPWSRVVDSEVYMVDGTKPSGNGRHLKVRVKPRIRLYLFCGHITTRAGRKVFSRVRCDKCSVPKEVKTEPLSVPELPEAFTTCR